MDDMSLPLPNVSISKSPPHKIRVEPNPEFARRKDKMWKLFLEDKDYVGAASIAATILQDAYAFDAIHVAGLALTYMDANQESFDWCCASLSLSRASVDWFANCAIAYKDKKDWLRAMLFLVNGIKKYPTDVRLNYLQGLIMCESGQWDQAIVYLDQTIALHPDFYHAVMSKGFCLHMMGHYDEAIECYRSIKDIAAPKDYEEIVNNWSCVLMEQGDQQAALDMLLNDCREQQRPGTLYNKSFLWLGFGKWPDAWYLYRHRQTVQVKGDQGVDTPPVPMAETLADIKDKHLFFFHEQGLGDSLMFMRYAPILRPHVKHMTVGVPKSMMRLTGLLDMPGDFTVISGRETDNDEEFLARCEVALPTLSAPAMLNQRVDNIPNRRYFKPVPEDIVLQRSIDGLCHYNYWRVGLVWAGASRIDNIRAHAIDKRRSIPFDLMDPILELGKEFDIDFVSLQLPDNRVNDARLIQPLEADFDVLDTAAVITQLDMVITIDSAVAHLAAAYEKPTWLLSRYDQCWRWFWDGRETSPWYPTMRIFQQKTQGDWPDVIKRVAVTLSDLLGTGGSK